MPRREKLILFLPVILAVIASVTLFAPEPERVAAQSGLSVELACPAGSVPNIFAGSVTRNPITEAIRYNFCVDSSGHLSYQGTGGGPAVTAIDLTGQSANISDTVILTPSANGFYRATAYEVISQVATTSASIPSCAILFVDAGASVNETIPLFTGVSDNLLGSTPPAPTPAAGQGQFVFGFYAKGGNAIKFHTSGYASSGATPMLYDIHIRVEGPF